MKEKKIKIKHNTVADDESESSSRYVPTFYQIVYIMCTVYMHIRTYFTLGTKLKYRTK